MPTTRTVAALALIAGTSLGRTPVTAVASTADVACIELRRAGAELVAVPVQLVSGSGRRATYPFLLDTGSEATFVDEELAGALGLAATSRTTVETPGGSVPALASHVSLTYGGVRIDDLDVVRDPLTVNPRHRARGPRRPRTGRPAADELAARLPGGRGAAGSRRRDRRARPR